MKIRLSKDEVYEIKLPDEIDIIEFQGLVEKFNFLMKNFQRFNISDNINDNEIVLTKEITNQKKSHDKAKWNFIKNNRDKFVEMFNIYYNKSNEEFEKFLRDNNLNFGRKDMSCGAMIRFKEFHKLIPVEVGLIKFPNKHEQIKDLRIIEKGVNKNE